MYKMAQDELINYFYPVGSIYETSDSEFDPNSGFGGSWTELTNSAVLISDIDANGSNVGNIVGLDNVTLTLSQIPAHVHSGSYHVFTQQAGSTLPSTYGNTIRRTNGFMSRVITTISQNYNACIMGKGETTWSTVGGGKAHNNMQPYIGVKRWRRDD